jgi:hypothetical protein
VRNYIRVRCVRIESRIPPAPFDPLSFYVLFGGDDENLVSWVNRFKAYIASVSPTQILQVLEPSVIWFELNQDNFMMLLNVASGSIFDLTRLSPFFAQDVPFIPPFDLSGMTRVESEGSPRATWSHGH